MRQSPGSRSSPRGITLVELMVALAVGTMLAGLLLGILIQANSDTDLDLRRERLLSTASSTLQGVVTWCERARPVPVEKEEVYDPDRLRLNVLEPLSARPGVVDLEPKRDEQARGIDVQYRFAPNQPGPDSSADPGWIPFSNDRSVWVKVSFRYAWDFDGLTPRWNPEKPGTGRPRAVEVIVLVQDDHARVPSVRLRTVVALRTSP